jgi:hypothetical protein
MFSTGLARKPHSNKRRDSYLEVFLLNHVGVIHLADVVLLKFFVSVDIAILPMREINA